MKPYILTLSFSFFLFFNLFQSQSAKYFSDAPKNIYLQILIVDDACAGELF